MICFMDKTYCYFYENCVKGWACDQALTEEVKKEAVVWWGSSKAPINVFSEEPYCFERQVKNEV